MAGSAKDFDKYLLSQLIAWSDDEEHIEIEGQRIEQVIPGIIQYNLLPKSGGEWLRGFGIHFPEERIEEVKQRIRSAQPRWIEPRNTKLLLPEVTRKTSTHVFLGSTQPRSEPCEVQNVRDWARDPIRILAKLEDASTEEKEYLAAILFAETNPFECEPRDRLLRVLGGFIEKNRLTEDSERTIYLCSAIRKYAMNMGQDRFESYCEWLLPTDTTPVHHEVEMELVKAFSYRLQFEELSLPQDFPCALSIISDLAAGYLRKALILQRSYANTAMLAIICVAILESLSTSSPILTSELLQKVEYLRISWFTEMVQDNLEEASSFVEQNNAEVSGRLRLVLGEI